MCGHTHTHPHGLASATGYGPNLFPSASQPNTLTPASLFFLSFFLCLPSEQSGRRTPNIILIVQKFYLHFPCLEPRVFPSQTRSYLTAGKRLHFIGLMNVCIPTDCSYCNSQFKSSQTSHDLLPHEEGITPITTLIVLRLSYHRTGKFVRVIFIYSIFCVH